EATMTLYEALQNVEELDESAIICARAPWAASSECQVVQPGTDSGVPQAVKEEGLVYFLEVHVALEVLEVFGDREASPDEKFGLLVYYAQNDAFPDWVYSVSGR